MRLRRHAAGLLAVLLLAAVVVVHHAEPSMSEAGGHHDSGDMAAMEMCLGALVAVGAAVALVGLGSFALGRWKPVRLLAPVGLAATIDVPQAVSRAGPPLLELLCVSRR